MGSNNSGGLNIDKPLLILVVGNPGSGKVFSRVSFPKVINSFILIPVVMKVSWRDWVRVIRRFLSLQKS